MADAEFWCDSRAHGRIFSGYEADHWCAKGHVLLCLEGELQTRLADGRTFALKPGMSCHVGYGDPPHPSVSGAGAKLFIVD